MQYHAHALAANGVEVDLVGFEGTPLPKALTQQPGIAVHRLSASTLRRMSGGIGSTYAVAGRQFLLVPAGGGKDGGPSGGLYVAFALPR